MKISTKGRYALRVMVDLALYQNNGNISITEISKRQAISLKYLEQIIRLLVNANLVISKRGANGGYRLTKKVSDYSVLEVIEACEGNIACVACVQDESCCERCCDCLTRKVWQGLNEVMVEYLSSITLQSIIDEHNQLNYVI